MHRVKTDSFPPFFSSEGDSPLIHFLLTPDKFASLALKRLVAEQSARLDVVIGTWPELLTLACNCHVLAAKEDDWQLKLIALRDQADAFWYGSLSHVPAEAESITAIVGQSLSLLLEAIGPNGSLEGLNHSDFSPRIQKRLGDLTALHQGMGKVLPRDLTLIQQVLHAGDERRLRSIRIYQLQEWPQLNPWQQSLIDHLNQQAKSSFDPSLLDLLAGALASPVASATTALYYLQNNLFSPAQHKVPLDNTLQWLAVRDYLQEVEVAAGMVQKALADDPSLSFADLALLLPHDDRYHAAVDSVFRHAGIPLSGLGVEPTARDLGGEVVLNLLLSLHKPAPVIALSALLVSPLMPWDAAKGNRLAQEVMKNRFNLAPEQRDDDSSKMLGLIFDGCATSAALQRQLQRFVRLLNRDERFKDHRERALSLCKELMAFLGGHIGEVPWLDLHKLIDIQPFSVASTPDLFREAVAVFHEGYEPWRPVRRLIVLGCSEGHYPSESSRSKVFTDAELSEISIINRLILETPTERNRQQRVLFRRQLCSAADEVTFLLPRRNPLGKSLSPSTSLTFAAALLQDIDHEQLALELDREDDRHKARGLATASEELAIKAVVPDVTELNFSCNLLELGKKEDGTLKQESPSRLEKLMISPLAWLFERLGVEAREWQPETLDIMSKGTLAHQVFEHLFAPGKPIPTAEFIEENVPVLMEAGMQERMPFLKREEWKVEREHLKKDILKAALRWGEMLTEIDAEIIATEISLAGDLGDVPIHGNADLLLKLPGERLLVVDYKKSASKGRRTRMQQGYDHQAELYRTMIKTGGLERADKAPEGLADILAVFKNTGEIGTLYYLMNDQTALADTTDWIARMTGEEVTANTSMAAMKLINDRINELKRGNIDLKLMESEKDLKDKRGLGTYALDSSPLVRMFIGQNNSTAENNPE